MKQRNFTSNYNSKGVDLFCGESSLKLSDFSSLSSTGTSVVTQEYTQFVQCVTNLINHTTPYYTRIKELTGSLIEAMDNLTKVTESISTCYKRLQLEVKKFNETSPFGHVETLENTYSTCANIFVIWANNLEKRKNCIKNSVVSLVDYSKRELETAATRTEFRNKMGQDYLDFYKKLNSEKLKLFQSNDFGKWKLDPAVLSQIKVNDLMENEE